MFLLEFCIYLVVTSFLMKADTLKVYILFIFIYLMFNLVLHMKVMFKKVPSKWFFFLLLLTDVSSNIINPASFFSFRKEVMMMEWLDV